MFLEAIPKNISPAVQGWWAKFRNDNGNDWYSPIAAWAICDVFYSGDSETYSEILPILTGEYGMAPYHQGDGFYECMYLPNTKFILSDEPGSFAWYPVEESTGHETISKNDGAKHDKADH
ncbi:hypothetical protein EWG08_12790 [Salmonella enterica subsp. enterica serovar Reading]|nr:hypothetical protein [Salmonella enterica subsp. enterica serovar Onderstepoort]ECE8817354.1 hypothetical protein [Salmonella enterica subsp. enterica serovar Reading]EDT6458363.1 hypothetical protein [Salmonella enterica subsp. enterica]EEK7290549.1 hypothetical protein [Salmonella enterica subsp. enterica serovar Montevideo]